LLILRNVSDQISAKDRETPSSESEAVQKRKKEYDGMW